MFLSMIYKFRGMLRRDKVSAWSKETSRSGAADLSAEFSLRNKTVDGDDRRGLKVASVRVRAHRRGVIYCL